MYEVYVLDIDNAIKISLGFFHSCALLDDGTIKCWGGNWVGELGTGIYSTELEYSSVPVKVYDSLYD